jgi:hypothetical protein
VLALVMCLVVLGVAGAAVLREGMRDGTDKRATTPSRTRRARPVSPHRPLRSGILLLVSTVGIGVLTAIGVILVIAALALALRSTVGGE